MAGRDFGTTWWGAAWLEALEQRALEDPNRLPRGRTYAKQDRVTELELSPGLVHAHVWGSEPYATQLSVRVLSDDEWDRVLDAIMARAANAAALLAGEVPKVIGDQVLPDRGDLGPACNCPDWAEPCKHAAALCYVLADLFDNDPFTLLTLRGRGRDEVLAEVRARRAKALGREVVTSSHLPRGTDPGVAATAAFKQQPAESPATRLTPRRPASTYRLAATAPTDSGVDDQALQSLVADAADRAWRMLAEGGPSGLSASVGDDVIRRAANATPIELAAIAEATGLDHDELAAAAAAWRVGARRGYRASRSKWDPPGHLMAAAAAALGPDARIRANRVAAGEVQLRLDDEGLWWQFAADDELGWLMVSGPTADPAELLADSSLGRSDLGSDC